MGEKLFTPQEVADMLRMNVATVHVWCKTGQLRALRMGAGRNARYRIPETAVSEVVRVVTPEGLRPFHPSEK